MEASNSFLTTSILTVFLLAMIIFYHCRKKLSYWSSLGIEQLTTPHWFFGHYKEGILFQVSSGWHLGQLYKRAPQNTTPLIGFYIFHKPCLLLRDPKLIKQIFIKDFSNFPDRNFAGNTQKDSIGLRNLFAVRGNDWKYMRRVMSPVLNNTLKQMLPLMTQAAEPMLRLIDLNIGRQLDAQNLIFKSTGDLIVSVALGTKIDSFSNPNEELPRRMAAYFYSFERMLALVSVFFMPDIVDRVGSFLFFKSRFVRKAFWAAMKEREKSGKMRDDFVDFAKKIQSKPQGPYEFSGDNLIHQAGTFFSGFESSATTAVFTLMELSRNSAVQERARADVRQAVQRHGWTCQAFVGMRYLHQCVQEAMRMHPQISTLDRICSEDYKIPDTAITIKKGTAVYVSIYGLHEDPRYFHDPHTFDPSRFDEGRTISPAYMPFGAGPRMCLGVKIGFLHAKVVTAMVLANYYLYQNLEQKLVLDPRSTFTASKDGVQIGFRKLDGNQLIKLY